MKTTVVTITCDLCGEEITHADIPFVLKTADLNSYMHESSFKQVGCDIVLTPRGNRLHSCTGNAMIRVNASFYCGSHDKDLDELHFHNTCIDKEVRQRVVTFFSGEAA